MANRNTEIKTLSVVLAGSFNPQIFHPSWFALNNIIKPSEAEDSEIKVVHPDITSFSLGGWLDLEVTRNKFIMVTNHEAYYEVLRDIVENTFKLLYHTPITAMGINLNEHIRFANEERLDRFFDIISPQKTWKEIFKSPSTRSLTISDEKKGDYFPGSINVVIEPSVKIDPTTSISIMINDHYDFGSEKENQKNAKSVMKVTKDWKGSYDKLDSIIDKIYNI